MKYLRPKPLDSLGTLRNRAIVELLLSTTATASQIAVMQVQDYQRVGGRALVRLMAEGVERIEPVDGPLATYLDEYIAAARIGHEPTTLLFRYLRADKISRLGMKARARLSKARVSDVGIQNRRRTG